MRQLDRLAQRVYRIPEMILMEHAGTAVAKAADSFLPRRWRPGEEVLVLAGGGANGGDGLVAARHFHNRAVPVRVVMVGDSSKVKGAARRNLKIVRRLGIPFEEVHTHSQWNRSVSSGRRVRLILDALLGTGVQGQVREPVRTAIRWVNRQRCPVVAVDLPSGLSSDTGQVFGEAVRACRTVTLGLPKRGLRLGCGPRLSGRVSVANISLPRILMESAHD